MVEQLGNGRAVSRASRLVRQPLRSTHAHTRASTRVYTPTVHTPAHIFIARHKHDHSTFLHLHADMCVSQWYGRARRALLGMASTYAVPPHMRGEPLLLVTMYGKGSLAGEQLGRAEARLCQSFAWVTVYCARGGLIELCTRVLKTTGAVETKATFLIG